MRWTRDMPGVYLSPGFRVRRNCDCGRCAAWVVVQYDETGVEVDRYEGHDTMAEAKTFAAYLKETG